MTVKTDTSKPFYDKKGKTEKSYLRTVDANGLTAYQRDLGASHFHDKQTCEAYGSGEADGFDSSDYAYHGVRIRRASWAYGYAEIIGIDSEIIQGVFTTPSEAEKQVDKWIKENPEHTWKHKDRITWSEYTQGRS